MCSIYENTLILHIIHNIVLIFIMIVNSVGRAGNFNALNDTSGSQAALSYDH